MAKFGWIITEDKVDSNSLDLAGPKHSTATKEEIISGGQRFRLKDDSNVVYYYGYFLMHNQHSGFEPLDNFGEPNAGCTSIEYIRNGLWEAL